MLKTSVEIQRATRTSDGAGGWAVVWAVIPTAPSRAFVKALSGSERWASERKEATTKWRAVVRYFEGIVESDRVIIRGKAYNITFLNNVELNDRWLEIELTGGVATP